MTETQRMKALIVAPYVDAHDVSESFTGYQLIEALSRHVDITLLCLNPISGRALEPELPNVNIVSWDEPFYIKRVPHLRHTLIPTWFFFSRRVRYWLKSALAQGRVFDLAHQLLPRAARYSSPLRHFDIPYIVGSVGGSLPTPSAFSSSARNVGLLSYLRGIDGLRFKFDPFLRGSYAKASLVLGVAPYMRKVLEPLPIQRYENFLAIGVDEKKLIAEPFVYEVTAKDSSKVEFTLIHVGRGVRTKGLRDVIAAVAQLRNRNQALNIRLLAVGDGPEVDFCRQYAVELGVQDCVNFYGWLPHSDVIRAYDKADIFVYPSFRESMGVVIYEALSRGLPVIVAKKGGPDSIVENCFGLKVLVDSPHQLACDLADAIETLIDDDELRQNMRVEAFKHIRDNGLWSQKALQMVQLYQSVLIPQADP